MTAVGNRVKGTAGVSVLGAVVKQFVVRVQLVKPRFTPMALDNYNCDRLA